MRRTTTDYADSSDEERLAALIGIGCGFFHLLAPSPETAERSSGKNKIIASIALSLSWLSHAAVTHQTPIVAEEADHGYHGWHGYLDGAIDSLRTGITDDGYNLIRVIRGSPRLLLIRWHFGQSRR